MMKEDNHSKVTGKSPGVAVDCGESQVFVSKVCCRKVFNSMRKNGEMSEHQGPGNGYTGRLKNEAISCKRAGNKQQALRCMRRRKMSERRLLELQNKLETVQNILERIAMAETDRMVVSAYEVGVTALRTTLKDVSVEKTESLVDQIQEFCDLQDDISQSLSGAMPGDIDVDVDDLERELNEILQEKDIDLPEVPTGPLIAGIISPKRLPAVQNTGVSAFDMSGEAMAASRSPDSLPYAFISTPCAGCTGCTLGMYMYRMLLGIRCSATDTVFSPPVTSAET
ncbi:charged multivesicular body protein 7-like [Mantella aurantiaca]